MKKRSSKPRRRVPASLRMPDPVFVTRPTMPPLRDYVKHLEKMWDSRWLTNQGPFHEALEARLAEHLGEPHVSLFCNGTIALLVALQALRISGGQVITTPFTFPATAHVLYWNRVEPVFCDIDPDTMNLDPAQIEGLIGPDTRAILPVHVYGQPCDVDAIERIAARHGLQVIYDAAHAFGVKLGRRSIAGHGDITMLSFHATKLFSSMEGGALVSRSPEVKRRIDSLKNFGIADEETVIAPGINGKMNEASAAFGLLHLDGVEGEIRRRAAVSARYRARLSKLRGIRLLPRPGGVTENHAYFPVRIDAEEFGTSRDEVHRLLREANVVTRKYFHPLASRYPCYSKLPSSDPAGLPQAERAASQILCLPIYGELTKGEVDGVCDLLSWIAKG